MMYKRLVLAGLLSLLLLAACAVPAEGAWDVPFPMDEADILLVYGTGLSEQEQRNVERLADAATYLGKRMHYGSADECVGRLSAYDFLICYDIGETKAAFLAELKAYGGRLLLLGRAPDGLYADADFVIPRGETAWGVFSYTMKGEKTFEKLAEVDGLLTFPQTEYESGMLALGSGDYPCFVQAEGIRYCPLTDYTSEPVFAALLQELTSWMWSYDDMPADYPQFLVLNAVYAFMPTDMLMARIDICVESGIPFVLSVMPVYQNAEYPAMQQFCEVLRYAQAHGGAVILHAPLVNGQTEDWTQLAEQLTTAMQAYTQWGVYPLGIQVSKRYAHDSDALSLLKRYSTVFMDDSETDAAFDWTAHQNALVTQVQQLIEPAIRLDDTRLSYVTAASTAVYVDIMESAQTLSDTISRMQSSAVPLKSLWNISHAVWGDDLYMRYDHEDGVLTINGEAQTLAYTPSAPIEGYAYQRNTLKRVTMSLEKQNKGLIALVAAVTVLFVGFIVYARRLTRRRFLYRSAVSKREEEKEGKRKLQ